MNLVFEIMLYTILHLVLMTAVVLFVIYCFRVVVEDNNLTESGLRAGMLVCGAIVVLASHESGVSVAQLAVEALSTSRPSILFLGALVPGAVGALVGWYMVRVYPKSQEIAKRLTLFVGAILVVEFVLIYATAFGAKGLSVGTAVIPNIAFVVGVFLYIALTYQKDAPRRGSSNSRVQNPWASR